MSVIKFFFSFRFFKNFIIALSILVAMLLFVNFVWLPIITQQKEIVEVPNSKNENIFSYINKLEELNLSYKIDTFSYEKDIKSHQVIYTFPFGGSKVKEGRTIFIKANSKTWRPVFLPKLVDVSKRLAFTIIETSDLYVGDTIYEPDIAKNIVKRILYKGREINVGYQLPRFSKIDVVLGMGLQTDVPVPNLEGLSFDEAKKLLKQKFFEIGKMNFTFKKNNLDSTNLKIYYQDPAPEDYLDEGMSINLWLSDISKDSLKDKVKNLHKTYRKYLIDSTGKVIDIQKIKNASNEVIEKIKEAQKIKIQEEENLKNSQENVIIE
ncbi:MAG: PASTA domain-containing protein [Solirubrobacteraceae bacterium]